MALTAEEVKLIQDSWAVVYKEPFKNGSVIFLTFIEKYNLYSMFANFNGIAKADVPKSPIYKQHVTKIFGVVNEFIGKLDKGPELAKIMKEIGHKHIARKATKEHFEQLFGVIVDVLIQHFKINDATQKAWKKGAGVLIPMIEEGLKSK